MKITCEVIADLLPSYADKITSEESNKIIEYHLEKCQSCNELFKVMTRDIPTSDLEINELERTEVKLMRRIRKRLITVITTFTISFLVIGILLGVYGNILFQEGNPIPVVKSIVKLETSSSDYIQFSESPIKFISKTNTDKERMIKEYMERKGWRYKEQMGNSYFFTKDKEEAVVSTSQLTGKYFVWKVPSESTKE